MRRAARIDANQPEIVDALRAVGAFVQSLSAVGDGCPDLLVSFAGKWHVIEIKDAAVPSERHLTPPQKRWHKECTGPAHIAYNVTDALAIVGAYHAPEA